MNERFTGILLQVVFTISIVSAQFQFQFPDDYATPQPARSTSVAQAQAQARTQQAVQSPTTYKDNSYDQYITSVVSRGFTKLALDVNRVTQAISPEVAQADYVVYGPVTITGALGLVLLASIGQTFDEIAKCLGLSSGELDIQNNPIYVQQEIGRVLKSMQSQTGLDIGYHVKFASAIFIQQDFPIRPAYLEIADVNYKSNVMNLDFLGNPQYAKHVINTWVSGHTNGKIPSLLDEAPPPETNAIVASVLYFQAAWQFPFFNGHTKLHAFYSNGRKKPSTRMVEMMSNGGEFPYYKDQRLGVEIMGFPYKGNQTTMYVIMPFQSNKERLRELENSLTPADIDHLVGNTRYTETVTLFPKMRLESTINLRNTLEMMGVKSLFDPDKANLALLSPGVSQKFNEANEAPFVSAPISNQNQINRKLVLPQTEAAGHNAVEELEKIRQQVIQSPVYANPGLYADQVIHKVFIDITESGTEAAAATSISLNRSGGRVTFRVDVPFLFFIYHENSRLILFWGSVKTPPNPAT
ncbi:hypothetical protein ILUMI_06494 [Ignelater luminosus]|uniref:Serpin domain-containing protein n=1 Tax=Ignelater luminosus TaxID=2038154 RepID=A0A8K0D9V4_IGNLU|nr:hypothetical protein ILUMI_06494 [Ignelater luminosus]